MSQLQNDNLFFDVQKDICKILNEIPELQQIDFFPANDKDLETEITKALRSQGVCGIVVVNSANFQGFSSGFDTAWQIDDLVVQVIENPVVNRASNNVNFIGTAEDIGAKVSQVLGGVEYGHHRTFNLKTIEIGEENSLLTSKVTFQCLVTTSLSSYVPPEDPTSRIPVASREWVEQNFAQLSSVYNKTQTDEIIENVIVSVDSKCNQISGNVEEMSQAVGEIQELIPTQASKDNQLADKDFVNSSIVTNTAYFKGTFNSVSDLPTTRVTPNDYAFVIRIDNIGQTYYDRYKYTADGEWMFEYSINNSGFTAEQFAAINSGATSQKIQQIDRNKSDIELILGPELHSKADVQDVYLKDQISSFNLSGEYEEGGTFSFNLMYLRY